MTRPPGELRREELVIEAGGPVRAELLPGCGHAPHHEAPAVVIDLVVDWLSGWMPPLSTLGLRLGAGGRR